MITKKDEKEFKKPKLFKIWNFIIYGSFIAIGVFLVYIYSAYIFINKWHTFMAKLLVMECLVFYFLTGLLNITYKMKTN